MKKDKNEIDDFKASATLFKEKFEKSMITLDKKTKDSESVKIISSTIERALADVLTELKPLDIRYRIKMSGEKDLEYNIELLIHYGKMKRNFDLKVEAFFNFENFEFYLRNEKKKKLQISHPVKDDIEVLKFTLSYEILKLLNDLDI